MHLSPARILNFIRREAVLCCAALAALASTLFVPPSAAYISYFDFRVLCLLFCLMAVVAGLRGCGLFEALALRLLRGKKTLRFLALMLVLLPFFSSMLVTNDVALLTFVPFAILILNMADASAYAPYIIVLQTVAANLGQHGHACWQSAESFSLQSFCPVPRRFFPHHAAPCGRPALRCCAWACCSCRPGPSPSPWEMCTDTTRAACPR